MHIDISVNEQVDGRYPRPKDISNNRVNIAKFRALVDDLCHNAIEIITRQHTNRDDSNRTDLTDYLTQDTSGADFGTLLQKTYDVDGNILGPYIEFDPSGSHMGMAIGTGYIYDSSYNNKNERIRIEPTGQMGFSIMPLQNYTLNVSGDVHFEHNFDLSGDFLMDGSAVIRTQTEIQGRTGLGTFPHDTYRLDVSGGDVHFKDNFDLVETF